MAERIRGRLGIKIRKQRLAAEPLCRDCKAEGVWRAADVIDHIVPLAHGGTDTDDNCRPLCHPHHRIRTAEQFGYRKPKPTIGADGWPS